MLNDWLCVVTTEMMIVGHKIKRNRRTKAQVANLDEQIIAMLKDCAPKSVLQIFYRMTSSALSEYVEKSWRGYRHVQARCVKLRRDGSVPSEWIAETIDNHTLCADFAHCNRKEWEKMTHNVD